MRSGDVVDVSRQRAKRYITDGYAIEEEKYKTPDGIPFDDKWAPGKRPTLTGKLLPPRYICGCGYVAKSDEELKEHKQHCGSTMFKLNLGCGADIRQGFINVDCREVEGVDLVADVGNLEPIENVGYILAYDIIEHFPQAETKDVLQGWIDLLPSGGTLDLRCPDVIYGSKILPENVFIELLYGSQDYPENYHKAGFTLLSMKKLLRSLRMKIDSAKNTSDGNLLIKASKR